MTIAPDMAMMMAVMAAEARSADVITATATTTATMSTATTAHGFRNRAGGCAGGSILGLVRLLRRNGL
jgi:hypothetical protein